MVSRRQEPFSLYRSWTCCIPKADFLQLRAWCLATLVVSLEVITTTLDIYSSGHQIVSGPQRTFSSSSTLGPCS
jgi:hypothetical protein